MNKAKLTARKLQMTRLGFLPVDLSRKELQKEWEKLVKEGKIPKESHPMTRRSSRARPGRKKKIRCISCRNKLVKYHNHGLCDECISKQSENTESQKQKTEKMNIPKMSSKKEVC